MEGVVGGDGGNVGRDTAGRFLELRFSFFGDFGPDVYGLIPPPTKLETLCHVTVTIFACFLGVSQN